MMRFVEHRIGDQRVLRLIRKWLKVGVVEGGVRHAAEQGTPQGAVISPLLANIYLHYAYDLWVQQWRTSDRVRKICRARSGGAGGRQAGDLRLSGFHPYLYAHAQRRLHAVAAHAARPQTGETSGDRRRPSAPSAPGRGRTGMLAGRGYTRILRLSRRADQRARPQCLPPSRHRPLATRHASAQPAGPNDLGRHRQACRTLPAEAQDHPRLAVATLPRQTPKVGAVCGNSARTDLCGGRAVMRVPTAIQTSLPIEDPASLSDI